jgi:hypothetical protein
MIDEPVRRGRPARAHFEPVGAHRVERAKRAVQARQDAHMVLREGERVGVGAGGVEAAIDVAGEGADRGALLGLAEGLEALVVELRQRLRNMHQFAKPLGAKLRRRARDAARLGGEARLARRVLERRGEIERLGGGEEDQHAAPR